LTRAVAQTADGGHQDDTGMTCLALITVINLILISINLMPNLNVNPCWWVCMYRGNRPLKFHTSPMNMHYVSSYVSTSKFTLLK